MNRRSFLVTAALAATMPHWARATHAANGEHVHFLSADHPLQEAWRAWKALCLTSDGRVIDQFQEAASHSEGQGYGLTLAAIFRDHAAAEAIIDWTERNLNRRGDGLLAWRWRPDTTPNIEDPNNASDGDLFYAWGLSLLGRQQGRSELIEQAGGIVDALLTQCTAEHPDKSGRRYLLPGVAGFQHEGSLTLNPSYYMPRAMYDLAQITGRSALATLTADGEALIDELAQNGLVPDWISLTKDGPGAAPERFSRRSGYEAMRVPLFALWGDRADAPAVIAFSRAVAAEATQPGAVTVFDPATREGLERSDHPGYVATSALATCATSNRVGSLMPAFSDAQPYYPATLHLMALVVQVTVFPRCVPI
ncbi:glycosyl hydrolase family 8 [Paracoccus benzoatiresistens]|uniref:cellulase n=1 Tax=Paracoccus benzoatiresistens TaxID=2997341 RepID=A0ABT4JBC2_9RHOB|nr:glycosyl hydrolase family 8 [Paracoccus sp. EF6]MCZ0964194.1 glycosyl hydrolase family 8 [Paracoccus sp. EF6]